MKRANFLLSMPMLVLMPQFLLGQTQNVHIVNAKYGYEAKTLNATDKMQTLCEGKLSCSGNLRNMFTDVAPNKVKTLTVIYECGNAQNTVAIKEALDWRIACPPVARQPTARADYVIDIVVQANKSENKGSFALLLPSGYNYCWHHLYDWSKNMASTSAALYNSNGREGITIIWSVSSGYGPGGGARGWMDNLWSVVGALPNQPCPPQ